IAAMTHFSNPTDLEAWVQTEMKVRHLPGVAVGVYRYGKPVEIVTLGYSNVRKKTPVTRDTVFPICSITKQFTAAAALLLVQDGKMRLDDPVSKYLTGFPPSWSGVTIRRLLSHTSGVPDRLFNTPLSASDPDKAIKRLVSKPLAYQPGD